VVLKRGRKKTEIPVYSFEQHQRLNSKVSIYSPHVIILEGILALNDPRILEMLDMKVFVEADADLCLSRRSMHRPCHYGVLKLTLKQASRPRCL